MEDEFSEPRVIPLQFRGKGFEYFKIWIVNLLLTILTLGIYSAWAKVRNNRYFFSNLYLESESFRYLADPITILKGRIIAFVLFFVYVLVGQLYPIAGLVFALVLMAVIPYFIVRSIAFNNRMTAYRNIQFRFHGKYGEAAMALFVWPFVGILTLGVMYPYAILKMNQFIVRNSAYGTTFFDFDAALRDYAIIFLQFIGGLLGFGALAVVAAYVFQPMAMIISVVGYTVMIVFLITRLTNIYYNSTTLYNHSFNADLELWGLFKVYAFNIILTVLTVGLFLPFAKIRLTEYKASHISFVAGGPLADYAAAEHEHVDALGEELGEVFDFDIGTF